VGTRIMTNPYGAGESRSIATDDMAILHRRSKEFRITNTVEVSDYCKRNPLHKVNQNMSAKDLIHFFGKSNEYIHRVAVVDDNHNLIGVLTQSMLLRCIHGNLSQMREINDLKAGSLRMTEVNKLATVPADMVAFDAFMTMHKEGLSSLAVVSSNGEIFENISATDLKVSSFIFAANGCLLLAPCLAQSFHLIREPLPISSACCCRCGTTSQSLVHL
jgi:CBS-domain-containing membrane protein